MSGGSQALALQRLLPLVFWPLSCFLWALTNDRKALQTSKGSGFLKPPPPAPGKLGRGAGGVRPPSSSL